LVSFVGREGELSRLGEALAGGVRLVLVVGDAGVGKTRLVGEGMRRAAAGGWVGVRVACLPLAEKLPLLPVAEALGELGRRDGGRALGAALDACPPFVPAEVGRLLPQLGTVAPDAGPVGEDGRRERLFAAVDELLASVARRSPVAVVVEDVHWADGTTLDLLTFLTWSGGGPVTVVATCRSDEAPLDRLVARWLAHVRAGAGVEEIRLGPLSRADVAEQVAGLVGGVPPPGLVDEVYARAEGNPFFTEQLVAVARAGGPPGQPLELPDRLAELLRARASRCAGDARAVLAVMAVAGRALTEDLLAAITGLEAETVRGALRELSAARLLADDSAGLVHEPRHALLAEAVAAGLLPGERVDLHERIARALKAAGGQALAGELAEH
jgi:predicted ATPase